MSPEAWADGPQSEMHPTFHTPNSTPSANLLPDPRQQGAENGFAANPSPVTLGDVNCSCCCVLDCPDRMVTVDKGTHGGQ